MYKTLELTLDTERTNNTKTNAQNFLVNTNDYESVKIIADIVQDKEQVDLTDATVKLAIRKPDHTIVFQDGTVTAAIEGECEFVLGTQSYVLKGTHVAEVMIYFLDGKVVVTRAFAYHVAEGILSDAAIESTSWYQDVNELQLAVQELQVEVDAFIDTAVAETRAEITEVDQRLTSQLADKVSQAEVLTIVGDISEGTPLFAPNTAGMTDTTRNYVNTTDGLLYTHNGTSWVSTGVTYQATGIADGAVTQTKLAPTLATKITEIDAKESLVTSSKNLFDPSAVIVGQTYLSSGALTYNANYKVSPKYPVTVGETISISGLRGMKTAPFAFVHLWSGTTFVSAITLPTFETTDYLTFVIPEGVTHFSVNINDVLGVPPKLQIEKSTIPTAYEPYKLLARGVTPAGIDTHLYVRSSKNLYDGKVAKRLRVLNIGLQDTANDADTASSFVPVVSGQYYTISGLNPNTSNRNILGYSSNKEKGMTNFVKQLGAYTGTTATVFVDDPAIKFIIFAVSTSGVSIYQDAVNNSIQVEAGQTATSYQPYDYIPTNQKTLDATQLVLDEKIKAGQPDVVSEYVEINKARMVQSEVALFEKDLSPLGVSYILNGASDKDSLTNNLFGQYKATKKETKQVFVNLANFVNNSVAVGKLKATPFTVPSGQFDNEGTLTGWNDEFNKDDYCHPDIAYDATGVAGYKYWMISSILPALNAGDVVWEDEDIFVSNDAKNWLRIKSLYEDAKSYTAPGLSLPPQTLATANARKHAFLPCPAKNDVIEISVPADNGMPALDRVNITLTELPWKHDPAILIDGGYVYTYHSFHLPYADRNGGKNRFVVCVRTNNGIDWEVVRTDGSTMVLTEATSRQIFTKDDQGRYNYMYYAYNRNNSNPTVLKYGAGDYEMVYGYNYTYRVKGTTPYNFDFSQSYPFQDVGSGNHPGLLLDGANLYLLNNTKMYVSTNRGETFTAYSKYPSWLGGVAGNPYKKTLCKGVGGKVFLVEAQRQKANASSRPVVNSFSQTSDVHQLYVYEYTSVADLVSKAQTGLVDGYVDVTIAKVNLNGKKRSVRLYPYLSNLNSTSIVNRPLQRIKVADVPVETGDTLLLYVTLNARNGARINFGGIDIL